MTQKSLKAEVQSLKKDTDELQVRLSQMERLIKQVIDGFEPTPASAPVSVSVPPAVMDLFPSTAPAVPIPVVDMRPNYFSSSNNGSKRYWDQQEHVKFLEAQATIGMKEVAKVAGFIGSRTADQVRSHAQKYQLKLDKCVQDMREQARAIQSTLGLLLNVDLQQLNIFTPLSQCYDLAQVRSNLGQTLAETFPGIFEAQIDQMFAKVAVQEIQKVHQVDFGLELVSGDAAQFANWGMRQLKLDSIVAQGRGVQSTAAAHVFHFIAQRGIEEFCEALLLFQLLLKTQDPVYFCLQNLKLLGSFQGLQDAAALVFAAMVQCAGARK